MSVASIHVCKRRQWSEKGLLTGGVPTWNGVTQNGTKGKVAQLPVRAITTNSKTSWTKKANQLCADNQRRRHTVLPVRVQIVRTAIRSGLTFVEWWNCRTKACSPVTQSSGTTHTFWMSQVTSEAICKQAVSKHLDGHSGKRARSQHRERPRTSFVTRDSDLFSLTCTTARTWCVYSQSAGFQQRSLAKSCRSLCRTHTHPRVNWQIATGRQFRVKYASAQSYMHCGWKRCTRAASASPSLQDWSKSVTDTPLYVWTLEAHHSCRFPTAISPAASSSIEQAARQRSPTARRVSGRTNAPNMRILLAPISGSARSSNSTGQLPKSYRSQELPMATDWSRPESLLRRADKQKDVRLLRSRPAGTRAVRGRGVPTKRPPNAPTTAGAAGSWLDITPLPAMIANREARRSLAQQAGSKPLRWKKNCTNGNSHFLWNASRWEKTLTKHSQTPASLFLAWRFDLYNCRTLDRLSYPLRKTSG